MSKLMELYERRNGAVTAARAFLDSKTTGGTTLSAEDSATYDKMEKDIVDLGSEIARESKLSAMENEFSKATSQPITNAITQSGSKVKSVRDSAEYKLDFGNALRKIPLTSNVLQEGTDADGGYLVPTEMENQIVKGLDEYNVVRSISKVITTATERKIPIAATHSIANWTAENAAYTESNPTFAQKTLDAYKLTDIIRVSIELLQDSYFDLESYIAYEFARAFAIAEEQAFCVGTGTGTPTGIFTANGGQVGVTAGSATAITTDNIIDLVYSLKSPYRAKAKFLLNEGTIASIRKLKDSNGAYLWQPSLELGQPDKLVGYPLYTTPYAPVAAASAFTIAFGDFSNYWIADRLGRRVQRLNEIYATNGQVGFIATERLDAKTILSEGIKLLQMAAGA